MTPATLSQQHASRWLVSWPHRENTDLLVSYSGMSSMLLSVFQKRTQRSSHTLMPRTRASSYTLAGGLQIRPWRVKWLSTSAAVTTFSSSNMLSEYGETTLLILTFQHSTVLQTFFRTRSTMFYPNPNLFSQYCWLEAPLSGMTTVMGGHGFAFKLYANPQERLSDPACATHESCQHRCQRRLCAHQDTSWVHNSTGRPFSLFCCTTVIRE